MAARGAPVDDFVQKGNGLLPGKNTNRKPHEIRVRDELAHLIDIFFVERMQDQTRCLKDGHWLPKHKQCASFDL
jgi:hypothetical protein